MNVIDLDFRYSSNRLGVIYTPVDDPGFWKA
jgi:hypothetical protein